MVTGIRKIRWKWDEMNVFFQNMPDSWVCHNILSNDDAYILKLLRFITSIAFMFKIYDYILINFRKY